MKNVKKLTSISENPDIQKAFVGAIISVIELHIGKMGAIKGLFFRKMYAAIKAIRPGYVEHILTVLSHDYLHEYSDIHEEYRASQNLPAHTLTPLSTFLAPRKSELKTHFWTVADRYGERKKEGFIGKAYVKFRPVIEENLPVILVELTKIIEDFTVYDVDNSK